MLAGFSFGGRVVMQAGWPPRTGSAGWCCWTPCSTVSPRPGSAEALGKVTRQAQARGMLAGRAAWLAHPLFAAARQQPEVAGQLAAMVGGYPGRHWTSPDPHQQTRARPIDALEDLAMPVLVAVGEHDVPGFREMSAVLGRRIPGAEHHIVHGAGHMTPMEQPVAVNKLLARFLQQLPPPVNEP